MVGNSTAAGDALFGRESELQSVYALIDSALDVGAALVVRGDAGVGKSAILLQAIERAKARGFRVLSTTGVPSETKFAFAALDHLLRPFSELAQHLPSPQRRALGTVLGRIDAKSPDVFLIALAALGVFSEISSDHPVLIVVDDAHWIDQPTSEVLAFVARRLELESIILLFAVRDGVESVFDAASLSELRLDPLDDTSAARVLERYAPALPATWQSRVLEEAAGNPLALMELPKALIATELTHWSPDDPLPLTARLERAFAVRISECGEETQLLLTLAALEESAEVSELLLAARLVLDRPVTVEAFNPATAAGLGAIEGGRFRYRHPLMRSAMQGAVSSSDRHRAHGALAKVLADDPDRAVWHRAAATEGVDEAMGLELEATAARAELRGGRDAAISALQMAAAFSAVPRSKGDRLLRAAKLSLELGHRDLSLRLLDECAQLELSHHSRVSMAYLLEVQDGRWSGTAAVEDSLQVAEDLSNTGDAKGAFDALEFVGIRSHFVNLDNATRYRIVDVASRVTPNRDHPSYLSVAALADPVGHGQDVIRRLAVVNAVAVTDPIEHLALGQANSAVWMDHRALSHLSRANHGFRRAGRLALLAQTLVLEAWANLRIGNMRTVLVQAAEAASLATETGQFRYVAAAQAALAIAEAERDHEDAAQEYCSMAESLLLPMGANSMLSLVELARGRTALVGERYAEAYQHLIRIFDGDGSAHHQFICSWALADITEAVMRGEGDPDELRRHIAEWEAVARNTGAAGLQAQLAYARPLLAEGEANDELFGDALAFNVDWPYYRARTQLAFGAQLRRQRRTAESRAYLRESANTFDALGLTRCADRARRELRAAGESVRRATPTAWDQLTAQELQIAQLASQGLTNREIGERLYLSHRTVGSHMYKLFPKLGVTTRSELRAALEPIVQGEQRG